MMNNNDFPVKEKFSVKDVISNNTFMNVFAGTVGGIGGVISGHPFDTIKVRLQTQSSLHPKYSSTFDCFKTIIKEEKILGLYKGMLSPLIGVALTNAFLFGVYGSLIDFQTKRNSDPTLQQVFIAGCGSGLANSIISCPTELAKIQLQNQIEQKALKGPWDCLKKIYSVAGLSGCFRGFMATVWRETPSYGVYFMSYELFCRLLTKEGNSTSSLNGWSLMFAGGLSGIVGWVSSYPLDVAKTKIQAQSIYETKDKLYRSTFHCLKEIVNQEGYRVLFRGLNATIIRAFPTNAVIFLFYSSTLRLLKDFGEKY